MERHNYVLTSKKDRSTVKPHGCFRKPKYRHYNNLVRMQAQILLINDDILYTKFQEL